MYDIIADDIHLTPLGPGSHMRFQCFHLLPQSRLRPSPRGTRGCWAERIEGSAGWRVCSVCVCAAAWCGCSTERWSRHDCDLIREIKLRSSGDIKRKRHKLYRKHDCNYNKQHLRFLTRNEDERQSQETATQQRYFISGCIRKWYPHRLWIKKQEKFQWMCKIFYILHIYA